MFGRITVSAGLFLCLALPACALPPWDDLHGILIGDGKAIEIDDGSAVPTVIEFVFIDRNTGAWRAWIKRPSFQARSAISGTFRYTPAWQYGSWRFPARYEMAFRVTVYRGISGTRTDYTASFEKIDEWPLLVGRGTHVTRSGAPVHFTAEHVQNPW